MKETAEVKASGFKLGGRYHSEGKNFYPRFKLKKDMQKEHCQIF